MLKEYGFPIRPPDPPASKNKRTKAEEVDQAIVEGVRIEELVHKYPTMQDRINKLAKYRPKRKHETDLVYYFGRPGTGKSTSIDRVCKTIRALYPEVDFYWKLGGMSKFWDGYDNQPIVIIDDPVSPARS